MKLGLNDVLLDPKTGIIYTPNTDKKGTMEEGSFKEGSMSEKTGLTKDDGRRIIEDRGWVTIGGRHVLMGKDSGLEGGGGITRLDMNGEPFSKPCVMLTAKEWKSVSEAIAAEYKAKYEGVQWARKTMNGKTYYFENRRFGDINIYKVVDND